MVGRMGERYVRADSQQSLIFGMEFGIDFWN